MKTCALLLFYLSIVVYIDSRYRSTKIRAIARERGLLLRYTRYISLSITESDSTESKAVVPLSVSFTASIHDAFVTHRGDVSNFRILSKELHDLSENMHHTVAYWVFFRDFSFWHWAMCLYDLDILIIEFDSFISSITSDVETERLKFSKIVARNIECFII